MSQQFSWWRMPSQGLFKRFGREGRQGSEPVRPDDPALLALPYDLFNPADDTVRRAHESTLKTHINVLLNKLHAVEEARRAAEVRGREAGAAYARAIAEYALFHEKQPPAAGLARTMKYVLIMAVLFIFELPLNAVVFRIFQESEVLTIIFTAGISVLLLLCAHELGRLLRTRVLQGRYHANPTERRVQTLFMTALFLLPLLTIVGIAYARSQYLALLPDEMALMSSAMVFLTFFTVNFAIFLVATLLAFGHYEPYLDGVARADSQYRRVKSELDAHRGYEDHLKAQLDSAWRVAGEWLGDEARTTPRFSLAPDSHEETEGLDRAQRPADDGGSAGRQAA